MEERNVPYIVHEGAMARMERTIKRLWILALVLVALLMGTNAAWLWYESSFETIETTREITQDVNAEDGGTAIINDGVHVDGTSETDN